MCDAALKWWVTVPFIEVIEMVFQDTAGGKKITEMNEDPSIYTIVYNIPFGRTIWDNLVEPAGGFLLSTLGWMVDQGLPQFDNFVASTFNVRLGLDKI